MFVSWLCLLVGGVLALLGLYMLIAWLRETPRLTARTQGRVLGYVGTLHARKTIRPTGTDEIAHLRVEFEVDGRQYVLIERQTLNPGKKYGEGTPVDILYDPANPECFRVADNRSDLRGAWALLAVAAALLAAGWLLRSWV